jgi:hypothetical protein
LTWQVLFLPNLAGQPEFDLAGFVFNLPGLLQNQFSGFGKSA